MRTIESVPAQDVGDAAGTRPGTPPCSGSRPPGPVGSAPALDLVGERLKAARDCLLDSEPLDGAEQWRSWVQLSGVLEAHAISSGRQNVAAVERVQIARYDTRTQAGGRHFGDLEGDIEG
jgi:hypothetical protein